MKSVTRQPLAPILPCPMFHVRNKILKVDYYFLIYNYFIVKMPFILNSTSCVVLQHPRAVESDRATSVAKYRHFAVISPMPGSVHPRLFDRHLSIK